MRSVSRRRKQAQAPSADEDHSANAPGLRLFIDSLSVVRAVKRPLQVEPVAGGDPQVHLHFEERLGEVLLVGLPSNAIHGGGHLLKDTKERGGEERR